MPQSYSVNKTSRPSDSRPNGDGVFGGRHRGVFLGKVSASADTNSLSIPAAELRGLRPSNFRDRVVRIVANIPSGKTQTYKEVATKAGHPLAARAVGAIMRANKDKTVPCHRVVKSNGTLGGYNGLQGKKLELLKKEGAL